VNMKKYIKRFAVGFLICFALQFTGSEIARHFFADSVSAVYFLGFFFGTIWSCVNVVLWADEK
jgi:hypothetical protein